MSQTAIKRRIAPTVPLKLVVDSAEGEPITYEWKLRINYNVLADAEEIANHNFMVGLNWVDHPAKIRALLWAAILPEQPQWRDEMLAIGELLDGSNRADVLEALFKAFSLYLHKDKRQAFEEATNAIVSVIRTGHVPKEMEAPSRPLEKSATPANPSPGKDSEQSPESDSESLTTKSSAA